MNSRAGILMVVLGLAGGCAQQADDQAQQAPMADSGISVLQKVDTREGTGAEARKGQSVRVHYTGWLYDPDAPDKKGSHFDSSRERGPFEFGLGKGEVITGWDEGVVGMKVGGTRTLTIPPAMAYGPRGAGGVIPPNATLIFEIELLDVR